MPSNPIYTTACTNNRTRRGSQFEMSPARLIILPRRSCGPHKGLAPAAQLILPKHTSNVTYHPKERCCCFHPAHPPVHCCCCSPASIPTNCFCCSRAKLKRALLCIVNMNSGCGIAAHADAHLPIFKSEIETRPMHNALRRDSCRMGSDCRRLTQLYWSLPDAMPQAHGVRYVAVQAIQ